MGKITGFREYQREMPGHRPVEERIRDFKEFVKDFSDEKLNQQAARCMDCGVPFCHSGCPLGNLVPDWNDLVYTQQWQEALKRLLATNNFPEFTGRICPAPCEEACVLGTISPPVTIEKIEYSIIERAFEQEWISPVIPRKRSGKMVAVIGSGPTGLATADQLNKAGHEVTVFERSDRAGGLLRYGIPDFKLEKWVVDRRIHLMEQEGVRFKTNAHVGVNYPVDKLKKFDAVVLAGGASVPRDLVVPGRKLEGIHFAMDFLTQQNKVVAGDQLGLTQIRADGKNVIVIGGGDTGSDCIGTSNRHNAKSIVNFELFPKPPQGRSDKTPWPFWPHKLTTSSSHKEGCVREWSILTKEFIGPEGRVSKVRTVNVEFVPKPDGKGTDMIELPETEREWPADLVLLAMGFSGAETNTMVKQLGLEVDGRSNIKTDGHYMTNKEGYFCAGDMRRGQSLIVWAISEGRETAHYVDYWLMGESTLPHKGPGPGDLPRL